MRAALQVLKHQEPGKGGRRILVLGDMLELGSQSADLHADLKEDVLAADVDLFFACGGMMRHLFDALPRDKQAKHAATSVELIDPLLDAIHPGDVITVKGSLGSRMAPIVDALLQLGQSDQEKADPERARGGR